MKPGNPRHKLAAILEKADQQATRTREEIAFLLNLRHYSQIKAVFRAARRMADSGVDLIDLTLGEDPFCFSDDRRGFDGLIESVMEALAC